MKHGPVRGWTTSEIPTLYHTLKATPFRFGNDAIILRFEMVNGKSVATLKIMIVR